MAVDHFATALSAIDHAEEGLREINKLPTMSMTQHEQAVLKYAQVTMRYQRAIAHLLMGAAQQAGKS